MKVLAQSREGIQDLVVVGSGYIRAEIIRIGIAAKSTGGVAGGARSAITGRGRRIGKMCEYRSNRCLCRGTLQPQHQRHQQKRRDEPLTAFSIDEPLPAFFIEDKMGFH